MSMVRAGYDYPSELDKSTLPLRYARIAATFAARARNGWGEVYGWRAYLELAAYREMTQGEAFSDDLPPGMLTEIRRLAADHGKAAASWAFDGNTSRETYEQARKGIDDGDPAVMDAFRVPDLGGEYAGDFTDRDLADELGIDLPDVADDSESALDAWESMTRISDVYLFAVSAAYWDEVERVINVQLAPCDD